MKSPETTIEELDQVVTVDTVPSPEVVVVEQAVIGVHQNQQQPAGAEVRISATVLGIADISEQSTPALVADTSAGGKLSPL